MIIQYDCTAMQAEVSPSGLPLDVWTNILRHLDTRARLTARLVCKAFLQLSPNDNVIKVACSSCSEQQWLSMLRFLSQQASLAEHGPRLSFTEHSQNSMSTDYAHPFVRSCIYLALSCRNLCVLRMGILLSDDETLTILKLAPVALQRVALHTSMRVVASPYWTRLVNITGLQLDIGPEASELRIKASGLAALASLHHLCIIYDPLPQYTPVGPDLMNISGLTFPSLHILSITSDPFFDGADGSFCPALKKVMLLDKGSMFPQWALERPIETLGCQDWSGTFEAHPPHHLRCSNFQVLVDYGSTCLHIGPLLKLPAAKCLRVAWCRLSDQSGHPLVTLKGTSEEYQQLQQKMQFLFDAGVEVQVQLDDKQAATAILQTGHAILCRCAECQK